MFMHLNFLCKNIKENRYTFRGGNSVFDSLLKSVYSKREAFAPCSLISLQGTLWIDKDPKHLNPFMMGGLFYCNLGQVHFLYKGCLVGFYYCHVS